MAQAPVNQSFSEAPPPYSSASPDKGPYPPGSAPYPSGYPPAGGAPYPPAGSAPPPGFNVPPAGTYPNQQPHGTTTVITQPAQSVAVVRVGNCPRCGMGVMAEDFTCCGICLGIFLFPIGILCCLLLKNRRCTACGFSP